MTDSRNAEFEEWLEWLDGDDDLALQLIRERVHGVGREPFTDKDVERVWRYAFHPPDSPWQEQTTEPPAPSRLAMLKEMRANLAAPVAVTAGRHRCERCGGSFATARSDARFCSNACRQAAYRARS